MPNRKKRTAVIGVGGFGQHHARNLNAISKLVAICDKNEELAKSRAALYEEVNWYTDIDDMLKNEDIEAVSIVTPPAVIPELAEKCAEKGIDCLLEKPMGLDLESIRKLTGYDVRMMPGFLELYSPVMEKAKEHLKEIGDILTVSGKRVGLYPRRHWGMGVFLDLGIHELYLHMDLLGEEVKGVKSMFRYFHDDKYEDAAYVILDFGEKKSLIEVNWLTPAKYRKIFISAEEGAMELDFITCDIKILKGYDLTGDKPEIYETTVKSLRKKEPLREELLDFLYSDHPKVTLEEHGIKTLKIALDIIKEASRKGYHQKV